MSSQDRQDLSERLFAVHSKIFEGVQKEQFIRYVIEPETRVTKIYLLQNAEGLDVGYITFQQFHARLDRGSRNVFRTEVGILPAYRGHNVSMRLLSREITKAYFKSGCKRSFFLATPIHPNPYCAALRSGVSVYPHPKKETPSRVLELMDKLSAALNISQVGVHSRYEKEVGWIVRENPAKRARVLARTDPASRFYLEQNPDYHLGNGMMMVIPVHPLQGIRVLAAFARRALRRRQARRIQAPAVVPVS